MRLIDLTICDLHGAIVSELAAAETLTVENLDAHYGAGHDDCAVTKCDVHPVESVTFDAPLICSFRSL